MSERAKAWLERSDAPPHLYELLGLDLFEPNHRQLIAAAQECIRTILPYRNHPQPDTVRRASYLLHEFNRAEKTFADANKRRAYDAELLTWLTSQLSASISNSGTQSPDKVRQALEQKYHVHRQRLDGVLAEIISPPSPRIDSGTRTEHSSWPEPTNLPAPTLGARGRAVDRVSRSWRGYAEMIRSAAQPSPQEGLASSDGETSLPSEAATPPPAAEVSSANSSIDNSNLDTSMPSGTSAAASEFAGTQSQRVQIAPPPLPPPIGRHLSTVAPYAAGRTSPGRTETSTISAKSWVALTVGVAVVVTIATLIATIVIVNQPVNLAAAIMPGRTENRDLELTSPAPGLPDVDRRDRSSDATEDKPKHAQEQTDDVAAPDRAPSPPLLPLADSKQREVPTSDRDDQPRDSSSPPADARDRQKRPPAAPPAAEKATNDAKSSSPTSAEAENDSKSKPTSPAKPNSSPMPSPPRIEKSQFELRHPSPVTTVAWSPDEKRLASAGTDMVVRIWDADDGKELKQFKGAASAINAVAWNPSSKQLAIVGDDGITRIWDVDAGTAPTELRPDDAYNPPLTAVVWRNDGRRLSVGGRGGRIINWDTGDGSKWTSDEVELDILPGDVRTLCYKPGAPLLMASCHSDGTILVLKKSGTGLVRLIANGSGDVWTRLDELEPKKRSRILSGTMASPSNRESCYFMQSSVDGSALAVASMGDIDIWDVSGERSCIRIGIIPGYQDIKGFRALAWSPDSKYLVAGDGAGRVVGWKVNDSKWGNGWRQSFSLNCPKPIVAIAWASRADRFAAACEDGVVRIWKTDSLSSKAAVIDVGDVLRRATKFAEEEEWDDLSRAVAMLRVQVLTQTQKLSLGNLERSLTAEAKRQLDEADELDPDSLDWYLALQQVIDLDPTSDAAATAIRRLESSSHGSSRRNSAKVQQLPYSHFQAIGSPNAKPGEDDGKAWAPAPRDSKPWIALDFGKNWSPTSVEIHETHNPGGIVGITVSQNTRSENPAWSSNRAPTGSPPSSAVNSIPLGSSVGQFRYVRLIFEPKLTSGMPQIDAVALVDVGGNKIWAVDATSSSNYSK